MESLSLVSSLGHHQVPLLAGVKARLSQEAIKWQNRQADRQECMSPLGCHP